jgi:hypothetical protein
MAPTGSDLLELVPIVILGRSEGVIRCPHAFRKRIEEDEARHTLRIRRREEHRHRSGLERRHEDGARRSGRIHHRAQVIHRRLECRHVAHAVREARTAAIETDHPPGGSELRKERDVARILPFDFEIAHVSVDENNIDRPLPVDRVRDRDVAALRVADVGCLHAASFEHGSRSV